MKRWLTGLKNAKLYTYLLVRSSFVNNLWPFYFFFVHLRVVLCCYFCVLLLWASNKLCHRRFQRRSFRLSRWPRYCCAYTYHVRCPLAGNFSVHTYLRIGIHAWVRKGRISRLHVKVCLCSFWGWLAVDVWGCTYNIVLQNKVYIYRKHVFYFLFFSFLLIIGLSALIKFVRVFTGEQKNARWLPAVLRSGDVGVCSVQICAWRRVDQVPLSEVAKQFFPPDKKGPDFKIKARGGRF